MPTTRRAGCGRATGRNKVDAYKRTGAPAIGRRLLHEAQRLHVDQREAFDREDRQRRCEQPGQQYVNLADVEEGTLSAHRIPGRHPARVQESVAPDAKAASDRWIARDRRACVGRHDSCAQSKAYWRSASASGAGSLALPTLSLYIRSVR